MISAKPLCMLRLTTVVVLCIETCLLFLVGFSLRHHKEWWVVMPIFAICSVLLWLPFHIIYLVLNWKLWSRVRLLSAIIIINVIVTGEILAVLKLWLLSSFCFCLLWVENIFFFEIHYCASLYAYLCRFVWQLYNIMLSAKFSTVLLTFFYLWCLLLWINLHNLIFTRL